MQTAARGLSRNAHKMATLYSYPLAFNPQKVLLALEEKKLKDVSIRNVNLFNGESLQPWFMRINPASTVPVLVTPGENGQSKTLNQTIDILKHFNSQGDGPLGGNQVDQAFVNELVDALHGWDGNLYATANISGGGRSS